MRLYAPLYEGDSFLRPDAAFGEPAAAPLKTPAPATDFVRSNIKVEAANETVLDFHAINQSARVLQSAELARLLKNAYTSVANGMKAAYTAVVGWIERAETYERDNFFAASANLADLEQRQRHFKHTEVAHY